MDGVDGVDSTDEHCIVAVHTLRPRCGQVWTGVDRGRSWPAPSDRPTAPDSASGLLEPGRP